MHNMLSMDLYRFRKTKSTYIIYIIFVALMAMVSFILNSSASVDSKVVLSDYNSLIVYLLTGNTSILLLVIFAAMFVNAEFNSGYIKNIMGDVPKKSNYVASKCMILMIYTAIFIVTGLVSAVICGKMLGITEWGNVGTTIAYLGLMYLLNVSFCFLILFATILVRNSAASTSIGVIYTLLAGNLLYTIINYLVNKIPGVDAFNILKYTVYGNMNYLNTASKASDFVRAAVVAVIFGAIGVFGSIQIMKRRDV